MAASSLAPGQQQSETAARPLAVVTGASSGIGFELARCCADGGYDLLIAADEAEIESAAERLRAAGGKVESLQCDLARPDGVDALIAAIGGRPVDALLANAGRGLGKAFLDQDFEQARRVIETNVTGTAALVQQVGRQMRERRKGRILITGSIAGFLPGSYQAVYNGSKAFLDSFAYALANELKNYGVTVTCLMPGATETRFFERADLLDTKVGTMKKDDPAMVAKQGFQAMEAGKPGIVTGWKNKLQVAASHVTPTPLLAEMHRKQAAPGTGRPQGRDARARAGSHPIGLLIGGVALAALLVTAWTRRDALARGGKQLARRGLEQGQQGLKTLGVFPETPLGAAGRKVATLIHRPSTLLH